MICVTEQRWRIYRMFSHGRKLYFKLKQDNRMPRYIFTGATYECREFLSIEDAEELLCEMVFSRPKEIGNIHIEPVI